MNRTAAFIYGLVCYFIFLGAFLYLIGFVGNMAVPKSIDSGAAGSSGRALTIDFLLVLLFGIQHTIMARPKFKKWWTKIIPKPIERSTFVLTASLILILLFILWQPIPQVVWNIEGIFGRFVSHLLFFLGWMIVLSSSFLINHSDLFGLRQTYLYYADKPYLHVPFKVSSLYRHSRHPMMLGFLISLWATPQMTIGHLLLAAGLTAYIFIGIRLEEQDIAGYFGEAYEKYRKETAMILPGIKKR